MINSLLFVYFKLYYIQIYQLQGKNLIITLLQIIINLIFFFLYFPYLFTDGFFTRVTIITTFPLAHERAFVCPCESCESPPITSPPP